MKEGIYEQVINKYIKETLDNIDLNKFVVQKENIDKEEARSALSLYLVNVLKKALGYLNDEDESIKPQIDACNKIISLLKNATNEEYLDNFTIDENGEILTAFYSKVNNILALKENKIIRPSTPLSQSFLFTGSNKEPSLLNEFEKEILSCDSIDMLVSFIKWSGIRCIYDELKEFTDKGRNLRIITTTYMGATDFKAIEMLSNLNNTTIKISYDGDRTRLHAKAYLFKRDNGFTTAYIGSSNISNPALTTGLEWNLKVTEKDSAEIVRKFEASFESYWFDKEFKPFNINEDEEKFKKALAYYSKDKKNRMKFNFEIIPYDYQKEILENLRAEREIFNRHKNLIVAATGVGKTVISAFDYKEFIKENPQKNNLLFVAHREEILNQSIDTFRFVLGDLNFGEELVGGKVPNDISHLFASVQSLNSKELYEKTTRNFYDFIIIDEFHHAAAPSYKKLLEYYKPKILLGLTATPERMDEKDILKYFDYRIASEMRLGEAINRNLLCPFQYFCVSDTEDLSKLKWSRKGYDINELSKLYTNNKIRANQIINSVYRYVDDVNKVKGLGFCVSVEHAKYMAKFFNEKGIPSMALYGDSKDEDRYNAKNMLIKGDIKIIFVVDLYNEGIDIKEINTVLFLRPTESLTIFLQQLGRGLRLCDGKDCLTVLDFVGRAHKNYNFEERFRALIGKTRHSVRYYLENGFLNVPKGCYIGLEKLAKDYILENIKEAALTKKNIVSKLRTFEADSGLKLNLSNFLRYYHISLVDFYGRTGDRCFYSLLSDVGIIKGYDYEKDEYIIKRLKNLFHINSRFFIKFIWNAIKNYKTISYRSLTNIERLYVNMFYYSFYRKHPEKEGMANIESTFKDICKRAELRDEIIQILEYNYECIDFVDKEVNLGYDLPLYVYCTYSIDQVMAAFGYFDNDKSPEFREGVKYFDDKKTDIFFITLNKSEKEFSPSTMYEDYAINERLFHWQTQSRTSADSATGRRYINHKKTGNKILLFIRENKNENGITSPFMFLGEAEYVSHSGDRPISFIWKLKNDMPPEIIKKANKSII